MQVTNASSSYGLVDGYAPISALPTIAEMPQTMSGQPLYKPKPSAPEYQGIAYNEAETSMFADAARTEFSVDGTGVTIGVISDSVNQYNGGLSESYGTLDLNPNNPVDVLADGTSGGTDEGRAMLENIHDVAPGASLAFATDEGGDLAMAQNVQALATTAKSNIIVDDVTYPDEPFFQPGLISQAVNTVVGDGVTYFSSAGNRANDGYLSNFRATTGSIPGLATGTFMNFNPSGAANILMPVTTDGPNADLIFEYDQPFATQQPAGSTATVTSNVNIYVIDNTTAPSSSGPPKTTTTSRSRSPGKTSRFLMPAATSWRSKSYPVPIRATSNS